MRKRKGRKEAKEHRQIPAANQIGENGEEGKGSGFFACYLLTSLSPRFKGHTYIGYTLNPRRRIRQHNGEIGSGAWRTKRKRPWEMVLCIYGFPSNITALQFEWAWQHPVESLAVRKAAASFKSLSGLANKIKLAYTMLTLPPWQSMNLTVNLFSTTYQQYTSVCPALPEQMQARVCSMDELPCYNDNEWDGIECDEGSSQEFKDRESTRAVRKEARCYVLEENFNHRIDDASLESSVVNQSPLNSSNIAEETESPGLVVLSDEPLNKRATAVVTKEYQPLIESPDISISEVEIIDAFTAGSNSKKRRRPNIWSEVIDLTNSPIYV